MTGERIYKMDRDIFLEIHPGVQLLYFAFVILVSIMLPHPAVIGCSFSVAQGLEEGFAVSGVLHASHDGFGHCVEWGI